MRFCEIAIFASTIVAAGLIGRVGVSPDTRVPGQVGQATDLGHGIRLVMSRVSDEAHREDLPAGSYASLLQGGRLVYVSPVENMGFAREQLPAGRSSVQEPDLLGNGHSQLLLRGLNSATYDHNTLYLFDLTPEGGAPRLVFSKDIEVARIFDLDGDGRTEILGADPNVGPPKDHPTLVFRAESNGLVVCPKLMHYLPGPTRAEVSKAIAAVRASNNFDSTTYFEFAPYVDLRRVINQLFYSGRGKEVQPILDAIWRDHSTGSVYQRFLAFQRKDQEASAAWATILGLDGCDQFWKANGW